MLSAFSLLLLSATPLPVEPWQIVGRTEAPITIHTFMDYQCRYCRQQAAILQRVVHQKPKTIKWVSWLWASQGERSEHFASIAYCVGIHYGQDAFSQFNQRFYALPASLHHSEGIALRVSLAIPGIDAATLQRCTKDSATNAYLSDIADYAITTAEFSGTPGLIITIGEHMQVLQGVQSSDDIAQSIKKPLTSSGFD